MEIISGQARPAITHINVHKMSAYEFTGEIDKAQGWQNHKPQYYTLSHTFIIIAFLSFV